MERRNVFYAQSGGATAVINATACGLIETARQHPDQLGKVFAGKNGIVGALREELFDTDAETSEAIGMLRHTPAHAFGSCRYKLKPIEQDDSEYRRLVDVFRAHDIGYFFYNGGNDSHDTANKVSQISQRLGYPLQCIGIPKTVDNDLACTDCCPGFGSVAKYIALSTREASYDVASMCASSTQIFILEVMGRHSGWIAAASGLAAEYPGDTPHIILFPEVPFDYKKFLNKVEHTVRHQGYCVIVVSEGARTADGKFLHESSEMQDAFGHEQLGGVAPIIARLIKKNLGYKYHWAVADYLQRSARHIASLTDVEHAYQLGKAAVEYALQGKNNIMVAIERLKGEPYRWAIGTASLDSVANTERKLPSSFINEEGYGITAECRQYLLPLIQGECYPPYQDGLPQYVKLKNKLVDKKLDVAFASEARQ